MRFLPVLLPLFFLAACAGPSTSRVAEPTPAPAAAPASAPGKAVPKTAPASPETRK